MEHRSIIRHSIINERNYPVIVLIWKRTIVTVDGHYNELMNIPLRISSIIFLLFTNNEQQQILIPIHPFKPPFSSFEAIKQIFSIISILN